jgi:hypothetical protein
MYVVFCLIGNLLSILAPMALKPGTSMPAPHQGLRMLCPLAFMAIAPIPLGLTLIPLGIEALLSRVAGIAWFPAFLVFGAAQAAISVWLYARILDAEGRLLADREKRVLEVVGSQAE